MTDTKLDVRVYPLDDPKGTTKAFASVSLDDMVAIRGIRVIADEQNGFFVAMPRVQDKMTGTYSDIVAPATDSLRNEINKSVMDEFKRTASLPPEQRGYDTTPRDMSGIDTSSVTLDIKVFPLTNPKGKTKAFATVSMDNLVTINGVRVVEGKEKLNVLMPQSRDNDNNFRDIAFPIIGDFRKTITAAVLKAFEPHEKTQKKSLESKLAEGAGRAAQHTAPEPARMAAKSRAGSLE